MFTKLFELIDEKSFDDSIVIRGGYRIAVSLANMGYNKGKELSERFFFLF